MTTWAVSLFLACLPIAAYCIGYRKGKEAEWLRREREELKQRKQALAKADGK